MRFIIFLMLCIFLLSCSYSPSSIHISSVHIIANEWDLKLNTISAVSGDITFELINKGKIVHEVVIIKTDLSTDGLIMDGKYTVDEDASGEIIGEIGDTKPGKSNIETFTMVPGRYLLVCNEAGHYKAGMVAALEVK